MLAETSTASTRATLTALPCRCCGGAGATSWPRAALLSAASTTTASRTTTDRNHPADPSTRVIFAPQIYRRGRPLTYLAHRCAYRRRPTAYRAPTCHYTTDIQG